MKYCYNILLSSLLALLVATTAFAGVTCDGADDRITGLTFGIQDLFTSTTGTLMIWVKATGSAPTSSGLSYEGQGIINSALANLGLVRSNISADRLSAFTVGPGGGDYHIDSAFSTSTWYHLAWVQSAGGVTLYLDGTAIGTDTGATNIDVLDGTNLRACRSPNAVSLAGTVANGLAFSTTLNAGEIEREAKGRMYQMSHASVPTAAWKLTECMEGANTNGTAFFDWSGNGRPLTSNHSTNTSGVTCDHTVPLSWPVGAN